jgi:hypothetical protein
MLRLVGPDDVVGAGVVTGAAEGEVEEPPQEASRRIRRPGRRGRNGNEHEPEQRIRGWRIARG